MNKFDDPLPKKRRYREPFEERVAILFEELRHAIKWQRSSILLAVYGSEFLREKAENTLQNKLANLNQRVFTIEINQDYFDIPLIFSQYLERDNSVFFIYGLKWGGGTDSNNAYRSLNIRREYFRDENIRVVFWLTESEAVNLPRFAPDFWSFRQRVVEFLESPVRKHRVTSREGMIWPGWRADSFPEDIDAEIYMRRKLLINLPSGNESCSARTDIYYVLASLSWASGEYLQSLAYLNQGKIFAQFLQSPSQQTRFWIGLGFISHVMKRMDDAISAYKKALELSPKDTSAWINLSNVYRDLNCTSDALNASKKAISLAPEDATGWNHLGNIYRDLRRMDNAVHAYENAIRLDARVGLYWVNLGTVYYILNRIPEAVTSYQTAIALVPNSAMVYVSLGACYRKTGYEEEAKQQLNIARNLIKAENEYCQACLESVCGNIDKALGLIKIALHNEQTNKTIIQLDPLFDFIRRDANFKELIEE
jgi:tetratricopeptide (TPR) repeat protein